GGCLPSIEKFSLRNFLYGSGETPQTPQTPLDLQRLFPRRKSTRKLFPQNGRKLWNHSRPENRQAPPQRCKKGTRAAPHRGRARGPGAERRRRTGRGRGRAPAAPSRGHASVLAMSEVRPQSFAPVRDRRCAAVPCVRSALVSFEERSESGDNSCCKTAPTTGRSARPDVAVTEASEASHASRALRSACPCAGRAGGYCCRIAWWYRS